MRGWEGCEERGTGGVHEMQPPRNATFSRNATKKGFQKDWKWVEIDSNGSSRNATVTNCNRKKGCANGCISWTPPPPPVRSDTGSVFLSFCYCRPLSVFSLGRDRQSICNPRSHLLLLCSGGGSGDSSRISTAVGCHTPTTITTITSHQGFPKRISLVPAAY